MKKIMILSLVFVLLLVCMVIVPALANESKTTIIVGLLQRPDPTIPGIRFTTDDILHVRGSGATITTFGVPWGTYSSVSTSNYQLNTTNYEGSGIAKTTSIGPIVLTEGTTTVKFNGRGVFMYHGPTFTTTTKTGGTFTVVDGTMFSGVLVSALSIVHGTINGMPVQIRDEFVGGTVAGSLTHGLDGTNIFTGTFTYWFTE